MALTLSSRAPFDSSSLSASFANSPHLSSLAPPLPPIDARTEAVAERLFGLKWALRKDSTEIIHEEWRTAAEDAALTVRYDQQFTKRVYQYEDSYIKAVIRVP